MTSWSQGRQCPRVDMDFILLQNIKQQVGRVCVEISFLEIQLDELARYTSWPIKMIESIDQSGDLERFFSFFFIINMKSVYKDRWPAVNRCVIRFVVKVGFAFERTKRDTYNSIGAFLNSTKPRKLHILYYGGYRSSEMSILSVIYKCVKRDSLQLRLKKLADCSIGVWNWSSNC